MRQIKIALSVLAIGLATFAQDAAPTQQPQLTHIPPKPTCNAQALFHTTECEDLWDAYNDAVAQRQKEELQLYVNKQKELATSEATAPLIKLSTEQQDQIKTLRDQMKANSVAALQARDGVHIQGVEQGAGGMLVLFGLIFGVRKLTRNFTITKKSHAASA